MCLSSPSRPGSPRRIAVGAGIACEICLSTRTHLCPNGGLVLDRDWNAALNILAAALVEAASLRTAGQVGTGSVSPEHIASGQTASTAVFARDVANGLDERRIPRRKLRGVSRRAGLPSQSRDRNPLHTVTLEGNEEAHQRKEIDGRASHQQVTGHDCSVALIKGNRAANAYGWVQVELPVSY